MKKPKRKLKALDKYVIFSISALLVFTIAQMILFAVTGSEQSTLIGCFFASFGGELLLLAVTKWLKIKREDKSENEMDC